MTFSVLVWCRCRHLLGRQNHPPALKRHARRGRTIASDEFRFHTCSATPPAISMAGCSMIRPRATLKCPAAIHQPAKARGQLQRARTVGRLQRCRLLRDTAQPRSAIERARGGLPRRRPPAVPGAHTRHRDAAPPPMHRERTGATFGGSRGEPCQPAPTSGHPHVGECRQVAGPSWRFDGRPLREQSRYARHFLSCDVFGLSTAQATCLESRRGPICPP